jgi:antiviral helicase SKI2
MKNSNKFGAKPGTKSGTPAVRAGTQGRYPESSSKGRDQKHPKHHHSNSGATAIQQNTSGPRRSDFIWMPLINNLLKKSLVPVCEEDCFLHFSACFNL